jgi:hypothetical protein
MVSVPFMSMPLYDVSNQFAETDQKRSIRIGLERRQKGKGLSLSVCALCNRLR